MRGLLLFQCSLQVHGDWLIFDSSLKMTSGGSIQNSERCVAALLLSQCRERACSQAIGCLKQRRLNVIPREPVENIHSIAPFELVSLHFVHLENTTGGYENILFIVDHFAQAYVMSNKSARTAVNKLYNDFLL